MNPARLLIIRSTSMYGGAERQIVGFASRLDKSLFEPVICGFQDDMVPGNSFLSIAAQHGLPTVVIPATKGFDSRSINGLLRLAQETECDLLCPQDYRADFYARIVGRRLKIPIVATAHGFTGHTRQVKLYETFDQAITLRGMGRIVCVSGSMVNRLRGWGIPSSKLCMVYNSIDAGEVSSFCTEPRSRPVICSIGRLSVEKGHRFLVKAWHSVLERFPAAKLILVGDGPEHLRLSSLASELGIVRSVEFVGFTDRPTDYLCASDIFVLPSLTEGLPVVLLEACAAAKPIIASDVGGIGEVITSGTSGILVRPKRPDELVQSILSLLENPALGDRLGKAARTAVTEKFSFEKNVPLLEAVYRSLTGLKV